MSLREVEKDLRQIKGIGDKRIEEIMTVIEKHLGVFARLISIVFSDNSSFFSA